MRSVPRGINGAHRDVFLTAPSFAGASRTAIERLAERAVVREFAKGEVLFAEGSRAITLAVVLEGSIRGVHYEPNGRAIVIETPGAGTLLGAIAVFGDVAFEAAIESGDGVVLAILPLAEIEALIRDEPRVALSMLHELAQRWVSYTNSIMRNTAEVPARLARYLDDLAPDPASCEPFTIELPMSRTALAAVLATTPETLSRTFHQLEGDGVIRAAGRHVEVVDPGALDAIAQPAHTLMVGAPIPHATPVSREGRRGIPRELRGAFAAASLWAGAPDRAVNKLADGAVVRRCKRGDVLFTLDEAPDHVAVVLEGTVRYAVPGPDGAQTAVDVRSAGSVVAAIAGFGGTQIQLNAIAGARSIVAFVPMAVLSALIESDAGFARCVLRGVARMWVDVVRKGKRNGAEVSGRIAAYLSELPRHDAPSATWAVRVPITRADLAVVVSSTPETVSRVFHHLTADGVIEPQGQIVVVRDPLALEAIARGDVLPNV